MPVRPLLFLSAALALVIGAATAFYLARPPTVPTVASASAYPQPAATVATGTPASTAPALVPPPPPLSPPPLPADLAPLAETTTYRADTPSAEVFRRAFWREPTPADRILHAERREWVGERDGVRRWQWFIVLDPSPELATWLRERNPFGLTPTPPAAVRLDPASQPAWFPASLTSLGECTVQQSSDGAMIFITETATGRLYATDRGHGFAPPPPPPPPAHRPGLVPGQEQPLRIPGDVPNSRP